jgi:hypothetical protein
VNQDSLGVLSGAPATLGSGRLVAATGEDGAVKSRPRNVGYAWEDFRYLLQVALRECRGISPRSANSSTLERAVPRCRGHIDAKVCRGNPWRTEEDRYVLCRLVCLVPADVGVLAEVKVGLA